MKVLFPFERERFKGSGGDDSAEDAMDRVAFVVLFYANIIWPSSVGNLLACLV